MERIQVQLTGEQLEKLRALAEEGGTSLSEAVRRSVDALTAGSPSKAELRERALAVVGRFASGDHEVTAEHDSYLADAFGAGRRRDRESEKPVRRARSSKGPRPARRAPR
jgi:Arc/MetJ-type ribon-helix-helix transcriptional regulator